MVQLLETYAQLLELTYCFSPIYLIKSQQDKHLYKTFDVVVSCAGPRPDNQYLQN